MKVSIIIPVYNQKEEYLRQSIESALGQQFAYDQFEVIVVDDGSLDYVRDICNRYTSNSNFRYFKKTNGGTASALNLGIKESKGSWIKWLSSDDMIYSNYLRTMFEYISKIPKDISENYIYYTHYNVIDGSKNLVNRWIEPNRNQRSGIDRAKYLWMGFYGNGSSSFINKKIFEKAGLFDETLKHSEDYEFWLRCVCVHDFDLMLIPEILLAYRIHPGQLSQKPGLGGSLDDSIRTSILKKMTPENIYTLYAPNY